MQDKNTLSLYQNSLQVLSSKIFLAITKVFRPRSRKKQTQLFRSPLMIV